MYPHIHSVPVQPQSVHQGENIWVRRALSIGTFFWRSSAIDWKSMSSRHWADGVMGVLAPSPSPSPSLTIITSKEGPSKVFELISCPEPVETSPLHFTHNNNHWFKAFPEQRKERSSWLQVCRWKMMKLSETFSLLLYWILGLRVTINKDLSFSLTVQVYLSATTWMCGLWFIKQKECEKNECI